MIVYDKTFNGIRYVIEANKIITHPDGTTETDHDWAETNHQALTEADDFSVEWADWTDPDGPEGVYWEGVGDYYYPTLGAAIEAAEQHAKEYLKESIDDNNTWNAAMAYFKKTQI